MQFNIINQTTQDAFFHVGLGSFIGTFNGVTLDANTSFEIPALGETSGLDITDASSAKLLFSLGSALPSDNPDFQYNGGAGWEVRWDKIEITMGPTIDSEINLSSTDFYGLDLQIQTFASSTTTTPAATLTWQQPTEQVFEALGAIANTDTAVTQFVVVPGTAGLAVPGFGDVLRVIAPSTVPPNAVSAYPSFQPYIDYIEQNAIATDVEGQYSNASPTSPATTTQTYDFTATVPTSGDLLLIGSGSVVGPNQTIDIAAADLAAGIYTANPPYLVNGASADIGDNDVYAAAVRDILGGFNYGFVGSTEINPNTGSPYISNTTSSWYNPQPGEAYAFQNAQPNHTNFYNQYAAAISQISNSYGFPFSDLLGKPQANIDAGSIDHVNITILPDVAPCFAKGTPILTEAGEISVELLEIGVSLPTVCLNRLAQVTWIGHRTLDCRRHPRPQDVLPVRVCRHAFGPGAPHRDVVLSPDHALLVDDVLIPVRYLVNGVTIVQEQTDVVSYWHVELDRHDVILAAGLKAESFLDTGNRAAFSNGGAIVAAHPDFGRWAWEAQGCAPLVVCGARLDAARAMLLARAFGNVEMTRSRYQAYGRMTLR